MLPNTPVPELALFPNNPVPNPPREFTIFPLLLGVLAMLTKLDNNPVLALELFPKLAKLPSVPNVPKVLLFPVNPPKVLAVLASPAILLTFPRRPVLPVFPKPARGDNIVWVGLALNPRDCMILLLVPRPTSKVSPYPFPGIVLLIRADWIGSPVA